MPAGCSYSVYTMNLAAPAEGAAFDLMLTTGPDCPWVLGASSYWLQWQGDTRGSGPVNVRIEAAANPSPNARAAGAMPRVSGLFVANATEAFRDLDWLQPRLSGSGDTPLVVELKADTADPAFQIPAPFSFAGTVYLLTDGGQPEPILFRHSVTNPVGGDTPNITSITDAGGFRQGAGGDAMPAARDAILTIFGERLADQVAFAQTIPLPTSLGGVQVEYFRQATQTWEALPLFFASPFQINFHLPNLGDLQQSFTVIQIRVNRGGVHSFQRSLQVTALSASLFTADSSGLGAAAGFYVRVRPGGSQERGNLFLCQQSGCVPNPIPRGTDNRIFLELYGTGFSHLEQEQLADSVLVLLNGRPLPAVFAGPNGDFVGLSQLNVEVLADIPSGTDLDLYLLVRPQPGAHWVSSNRLTIRLNYGGAVHKGDPEMQGRLRPKPNASGGWSNPPRLAAGGYRSATSHASSNSG